jgi:DNA-binding NarL/FixJ family response regulator
VIGFVALGATSPEIAQALDISVNTVRKHVASAMRKLHARSRAHLVAKTLGEGIQTGHRFHAWRPGDADVRGERTDR